MRENVLYHAPTHINTNIRQCAKYFIGTRPQYRLQHIQYNIYKIEFKLTIIFSLVKLFHIK